jgi:hypothetical protein
MTFDGGRPPGAVGVDVVGTTTGTGELAGLGSFGDDVGAVGPAGISDFGAGASMGGGVRFGAATGGSSTIFGGNGSDGNGSAWP